MSIVLIFEGMGLCCSARCSCGAFNRIEAPIDSTLRHPGISIFRPFAEEPCYCAGFNCPCTTGALANERPFSSSDQHYRKVLEESKSAERGRWCTSQGRFNTRFYFLYSCDCMYQMQIEAQECKKDQSKYRQKIYEYRHERKVGRRYRKYGSHVV